VLGVVLALFMVESVSALRWRVSTPRPTDGRLVLRTSYDGSMESHPDQRRPVPRVHPLEIPFVWFGLQLIEFALVWLLISTFVPEDTPSGVGIAAFLAIWVPVSIVNYRIRRRFIPR
jgi:hypothetical protein